MKKSFFLLALCISSASLMASNISHDGIWYDLDFSNHTATVTYKGSSYYEYSNNYAGSVIIPTSFEYLDGNTYTVTAIGKAAFQECSSLTSVSIPNSVTSIGESAFAGCSSLTSINIPNGITRIENYTFCLCTSLTSITIPKGVTSIGTEAFSGSSLMNVSIPNNVIAIGSFAFAECSYLTSINIPENIVTIEDGVFRHCSSLASIKIPNSVTSVGKSAFEDCSGLTFVTIGNSVTSIGNSAFKASGLTKVSIPNSVTSIGEYAFGGCTNLTSVDIPESVNSMGGNAFYWCTSLTKVNITNLVAWCKIKFSGREANPLYYAHHLYLNENEITEIIIPSEATSIGSYAFMGCSNFTSATIPESVAAIGEKAFADCSNLKTVYIDANAVVSRDYSGNDYSVSPSQPNYKYNFSYTFGTQVEEYVLGKHITEIGNIAFEGCTNLKTINIPNSVSVIGNEALYCDNLHIIYCCRTIPVSIQGKNVFPKTVPSLDNILYVPQQSMSLYLNADTWKEFTILPLPKYSITATAQNGSVIGAGEYEKNAEIQLSVTPNIGYRFVKWSDENTDNPRTLTVTEDAVYEAICEAIPIYTITANATNGTVIGAGTYQENEDVTLTVTPNDGYRFIKWSDENTDNPRTITVTEDATYEAICDLIPSCTITVNATNGVVGGAGTYILGTTVTLDATANDGYHFAQWSDGNKDNPRSVIVTQDTTFTAEFEVNIYQVQFFGFENALIEKQSVEHGKAAIAPEVPVIEYYDFVRWDKEFTNITSDLDVFAIYEENTDDIEDMDVISSHKKIVIEGQIFILRGEKTYTLTGQEVK